MARTDTESEKREGQSEPEERQEAREDDRGERDDSRESLEHQPGAQHPGGYHGAKYDEYGQMRPGGIQRWSGQNSGYVRHHDSVQRPEDRGAPGGSDGYDELPVNVYGGVEEFHQLNRNAGHDHGSEDYRGVGPKGYRRSAARIHEEICHLLTEHPAVDPSRVEVEVDDDGVVHLHGHTASRRMKRTVEHLCDQVQGVRDVDNRIEIDR